MGAITLKIVMDDADFGYLTQNSAEWGTGFAGQVAGGRFETGAHDVPLTSWKRAYWLGDSYTSVILARAFLAAWGYDCQVLIDQASDGEWVILTDYEWKG